MIGGLNPHPGTVITFTRAIHHDTYPFIDPTRLASFRSQHVFVTGASRSIGRAMAVSYAKAGAAMIAISAQPDDKTLSDVKAEVEAAAAACGRALPLPKVVPVRMDSQDESSVAAATAVVRKELRGRLDVLVNNSAWSPAPEETLLLRPPSSSSSSTGSGVGVSVTGSAWETNVRGPWLVTRAFLPVLLESEESSRIVVNVSSIGAQMITAGGSAYQTARFSLLRLTEFMNAEYGGPRGVVVYCMYPGAVPAELNLGSGLPEELAVKLVDTPELVADTNTFLTQERREWLGGRYIACTWDMEEFLAKKDEIVATDRLKMKP